MQECEILSVSYTHLDVYKRQAMYSQLSSIINELIINSLDNFYFNVIADETHPGGRNKVSQTRDRQLKL